MTETAKLTSAVDTSTKLSTVPGLALDGRLVDVRERISWMCHNGSLPRMSIPARPDVDDDFVICDVIDEAREMLKIAWALVDNAGTPPGDWESMGKRWQKTAQKWRVRLFLKSKKLANGGEQLREHPTTLTSANTQHLVRRIHSFPVGGEEPLHICSPECWCYPVKDVEQPMLWVHNAKDCREQKERAGRTDMLAVDSLWVLAFENVDPNS